MAIEAKLDSGNLGFAFGAPQEMVMDNANCGFFIPQRQQWNQFQNLPQQSMLFSHSFSERIEKQRMEIDRFIALESERLRLAMQEQRKQQIQLIIKKYESKSKLLLAQKDEEIARAGKRTIELKNFIRSMEIENQTWQRVAKENEAMAASLNTTIERLKITARTLSSAAEDAESCCQNIEEEEEEEEKTENGNHDSTKKMLCRCCNSRNSCVIMLPCRHLCSCKDCEAFLDSCPVCRIVKTASIEALI